MPVKFGHTYKLSSCRRSDAFGAIGRRGKYSRKGAPKSELHLLKVMWCELSQSGF